MHSNARSLTLLGIAVATCALAAALYLVAGTPKIPSALAPAASGWTWHEGERSAYALELTSTVSLNPAAGAASELVQRLSGRLDVEVLELSPDEVQLGLRLGSARLTVGGAGEPAVDERLSQPFQATLSRAGRVLTCDAPAACGLREGELLVELVRALEVVVPDGAGEAWTLEERDATGSYVAAYRRLAPNLVEKQRLRYLAVHEGQSVTVLRSTTVARLSAGASWLDGLDGELGLRVENPVGEFVVHTSTRLERVLGPPPEPWITPAETSGLRTAANSTPKAPGATPAAAPQPFTPELERELRARLAAIDAADRASGSDRLALRELLAACPELALRIPALLLDPTPGDKARAALLHALEVVGSAEAQSSLGAVLCDADQSQADQLRAALAIAGLERPDPGAVAALWSVVEQGRGPGNATPVTASATLALGAAAGALGATDAARAEALRNELVGALGSSNGSDAPLLLGALGNTKDASLGPDIAPYLDATDSATRAAAAGALGRLDAENGPELLTRRLENEPSSDVRAALATALGQLSATSDEAAVRVEAALRRESDERVRFALTSCLARYAPDRPEARELLEEIAASPGSRRTRRAAGDALAAQRAAQR